MTTSTSTSKKSTKSTTFVQTVLNAIRTPKPSNKVIEFAAKAFPKKSKQTVAQNTRWYLSNLVARKLAKHTAEGLYVATK